MDNIPLLKINNIPVVIDKDDEVSVPFWANDPNILLRQDYILEFFPTENMVYEQKLNAISRMVILITVVSFFMSKSFRLLIISIITLTAIYLLYKYQDNDNKIKINKQKIANENFENQNIDKIKNLLNKKNVFEMPNSENPFGNVLNTDIATNPNKNPAPPAYNENVSNQILEQAKQVVRDSNPEQPDISDKLFKDLGDQYIFEQSLRQFNTNPNTTIPNDQAAFSDFKDFTILPLNHVSIFKPIQ